MKFIKIIAMALVLTGLSMADASAANLLQRRHYHHYRHHHYRHHHYRAHARVDINLPPHPRPHLPPPPPPPPRP